MEAKRFSPLRYPGGKSRAVSEIATKYIIPNIPKKGQRLEDVGKFRRCDLTIPHNLKAVFKTMRNYLAQNVVGATRDETIAQQLINLIFYCNLLFC